MAAPAEESGTLRRLGRNLLLTSLLAAALYVFFTAFDRRVLHGFSDPEILLLEAGAVVLVAWLVSRSVTSAASAVLRPGHRSRGHIVRLFLNLLIAVGAVFALFDLAGVSAESIFLGSAFAGIVLGLAAQTVLANVFAGILLAIADPFRPGDRISLVSSSYGALAPSYPHEMMYPTYAGYVEDVGLIYTVLSLDSGGRARVPNSVVMTALVLQPGMSQSARVRMTFPLTVTVPQVETALAELTREFPPFLPRGPPVLEVTDISASTWDAVITIWSRGVDESRVRDRVMREVLRRVSPPVPAAARPTA